MNFDDHSLENENRMLLACLRAWVAGCGDEWYATKEECRALLQSSGDLIAAIDARGMAR